MDDLTQSKYIDLLFTDIGIFTPQTASSELSNLLQWFVYIFTIQFIV